MAIRRSLPELASICCLLNTNLRPLTCKSRRSLSSRDWWERASIHSRMRSWQRDREREREREREKGEGGFSEWVERGGEATHTNIFFEEEDDRGYVWGEEEEEEEEEEERERERERERRKGQEKKRRKMEQMEESFIFRFPFPFLRPYAKKRRK